MPYAGGDENATWDQPVKRLGYQEPQPVPQERVAEILRSGSVERIAFMLIEVAFHEEDLQFALDTVMSCVVAENANVRGNAVLCLGHLARIHGQLPLECLDVINGALRDPDDYVRDHATSAAEDVGQFIPALRPLLAVSRWTWGATLEVVTHAPAAWRPGTRGLVVGARVIETETDATQFEAAIGSTVCSLESEDDEILDVPERWLVVIP